MKQILKLDLSLLSKVISQVINRFETKESFKYIFSKYLNIYAVHLVGKPLREKVVFICLFYLVLSSLGSVWPEAD